MARPAAHSEDAILDGARGLVASSGPRSLTVGAIAAASGAPTGSIYHRFHSLDDLLARLWLRAAMRVQEQMLAVDLDDPLDGAVQVALAAYDFCLGSREDALLLGAFRAQDLLAGEVSAHVREALTQVNVPVEGSLARLARRLRLRGLQVDTGLLELSVVELPYGFARPYLEGERRPPRRERDRLTAAVLAALGGTSHSLDSGS